MPKRATTHLDAKVPFPSAMRTAEWSHVPLEIRERAFFMAAVEDAEILALFQRESRAIAAGESSNDESMRRIRTALEAMGYQPEAGEEGTIHDLRSLRRMRVVLDTNVEMARGHAMWVRAQGSILAFPAWRYIRAAHREVPRDWPGRWAAAREATVLAGATAGDGGMVALVNHPLWRDGDFNRFQSPYPPFDFQSGMSVSPVRRSEARELGLLSATEHEQEDLDAMLKPVPVQSRSFNESLVASPKLDAQEQRTALADRLRGLAEWEGDQLVHLDPNGTRPGTPEEIARVVTAPLPTDPATGDPWPTLQADAADALLNDELPEDAEETRLWDLARLLGRSRPEEERADWWLAIGAMGIGAWFVDRVLPGWLGIAGPKRGKAAGRASRRDRVLAVLDFLNPIIG